MAKYAFPQSLLILVFSSAVFGQSLEITVIDVGQGDAILIRFPPNAAGASKHMLIDGGGSEAADSTLVTFLQAKGIATLDVVVLTHPHQDHFRGLTEVFNQFTVKEFWWTGEARGPSRDAVTPTDWAEFETAMNRAEEQVIVSQNMSRSFQRARIKVLNAGGEYPDTSDGVDINNDSMVLLLSYRGVRVLFPGDIEEDEGKDLVNDYCSSSTNHCRKLNVDVIKIPHHGSDHLWPDFVRFADAEIALLSAGHSNRQFHHPRRDAIRAYEEAGAEEVFSTSLEGINHITVTIGPTWGQFTVTGASSGYTFWRNMDDDESCDGEVHNGYCLEIAE